ncbi:MAG: hypothetical protein FWE62_04930 [Firmicutes bacterium]|nr:hypothetical protein [Bacillota bacterium]
MKIEHTDESGNSFVYNESVWTGRKTLTFNGQPCAKVARKQFQLPDGSYLALKGSFLMGITATGSGKSTAWLKNKWWETLLILLPCLYLGLGIFCGALGGALSGGFFALAAAFNAAILRTTAHVVVKIIFCLVVFAVLFLAWFMIYALIVGGLAVAFPGIFS